ncbi:F-box protein-like [Forsythia ovata]|uniref:F-box protein-like n=1 Tax=Forsythia ovata TaxID=205694 RepID=A0ABD1PI28_9LAMI
MRGFSMVAEFRNVRRLDIRGKIEGLYSKTRYGAYLVFKLGKNIRGLGSANGIIKFVKYDEDVDAEKRATIVYLQPNKDGNGQTAVWRLDGWMEIELGKFYYDLRDNGPVEARLLGNNFNTKVDIIVAGIELRMRGDTREFMRY